MFQLPLANLHILALASLSSLSSRNALLRGLASVSRRLIPVRARTHEMINSSKNYEKNGRIGEVGRGRERIRPVVSPVSFSSLATSGWRDKARALAKPKCLSAAKCQNKSRLVGNGDRFGAGKSPVDTNASLPRWI